MSANLKWPFKHRGRYLIPGIRTFSLRFGHEHGHGSGNKTSDVGHWALLSSCLIHRKCRSNKHNTNTYSSGEKRRKESSPWWWEKNKPQSILPELCMHRVLRSAKVGGGNSLIGHLGSGDWAALKETNSKPNWELRLDAFYPT